MSDVADRIANLEAKLSVAMELCNRTTAERDVLRKTLDEVMVKILSGNGVADSAIKRWLSLLGGIESDSLKAAIASSKRFR